MSPHGRFSIRKLLTNARRRSAVVGDSMSVMGMHTYGDENDEDDPVYIKRSASAGGSRNDRNDRNNSRSGSSNSFRSAPKAPASHSRAGSRNAADPDADEVERVKVAVAAAAAHAATSLRFRLDGDGDGDGDDGVESVHRVVHFDSSRIDKTVEQKKPRKKWPMLAPILAHRSDAKEEKPGKGRSRVQPVQPVQPLQPVRPVRPVRPMRPTQPTQTQPLALHEQQAQQVDAENSQDRLCSANGLSTNTTTTTTTTTTTAQYEGSGAGAAPNPAAADDPKQARQSGQSSQSSQSSCSCQSWRPPSPLSSPASSLIHPSPPPLLSAVPPQPARIPTSAAFEPSSPTPTSFSTTTDDGSLSWPSTPLQNSPPSLYNAESCPARASPSAASTERSISDEKKDSGVSLDQVDESELREKEAEIESETDKRQLRKRDSLFGFSQGPTLNLIEALSIEPEEAISLRQECQQQYQPHHFRRTAMNANLHVSPCSGSGAVGATNATNAADAEPPSDACMSPTFTRPRPAPLPTGQRSMAGPTPLTPPYTPLTAIPTFRTPDAAKARSGQAGKKFTPLRIRPAGLARKPSVAVSRPAQRKRSTKKARRRDRPTAGRTSSANSSRPASQTIKAAEPVPSTKKTSSWDATHHHHHTRSSSSGGSSRWALPDNMSELFNGLLFGRMEVTEMLPPEQLKAIRESRAVIAMAAAAAAAAEQEKKEEEERAKEEAEKLAKEQAKEQAKVQKEAETEKAESVQSAPLPDLRVDMEGHAQPEDEDGEKTPRPPQRLPPPVPLPFASEDPDGCQTPEEPFHLQDLPSRIGAAGVRLSVLQPMEEEAKAFDNSLALKRKRDEERERKEAEEKESKEREEAESNASKQPPKEKSHGVPVTMPATMPTIPELTVTEASCATPRAAVVPSKPTRMGAIRSGTIRSTMHVLPLVPMVTVVTVDDDYIRLPVTPYSLVMPTFRHGPVRLPKPESEAMMSRSRRQMMATDDTLDWTAFQMAILGGAGDFFSDSVDYGRASADADELDDLVCWYCSLELPPEQILYTKEEEILVKGGKKEASVQVLTQVPPPKLVTVSAVQTPPPVAPPVAPQAAPPTVPQAAPLTAPPTAPPQTPLPPPPQSLYPPPFNTGRPRSDSTVSSDSYDSMPQSPLADVVMSRAADGTEYAVPMGYNLGHDLGEFLRWETENVSKMEL